MSDDTIRELTIDELDGVGAGTSSASGILALIQTQAFSKSNANKEQAGGSD